MKFWIVGPTASGKTQLSIKLSQVLNVPIVNCDSRQFWKNMVHLPCSPTNYENCDHLLFNCLSSHTKPSLGWWSNEIRKIPHDYILCGGTVFYGWSLLRGIPIEDSDSDAVECFDWNVLNNLHSTMAARINHKDHYRINRAIQFVQKHNCDFHEYQNTHQEDLFVILLKPSHDFLLENITNRIENNLSLWLEEVKNQQHVHYTTVIGYSDCVNYLNNNISLCELKNNIYNDTVSYVKKQKKIMKKITPNITINYDGNYDFICNEVINSRHLWNLLFYKDFCVAK